ncbi:hypothetical protein GQ457_14G014100 [Hibiscus cannabinus]
MFKKVIEKLGLKIEETTGMIKIVNTLEVPIVGITRKVELHIDEKNGNKHIKVIHFDNFDFVFVLGLSFIDYVNALIIPCANFVCIFILNNSVSCHCIETKRKESRRWLPFSLLMMLLGRKTSF